MARTRRKPIPEDSTVHTEAAADAHYEALAEKTSETPTAAQIIEAVAEATKMPEDKPAGFSEKVGKRPQGYTNVGTTDYIAGVRIHEYQNRESGEYLSIVKFEEKPSKEVTTLLRKSGFDWNRENQEWYRPIRYETRQQDRITADETFAEVCKQVRTEKGVEHSYGVSR